MEFLEALRQAKEVGLSEADFKVQWDKEREREEKNKEREEKNKEREEKDKERGERQKEREYNLQKIQKEKELAEVGGSVTTVKQEVGSVKGPRIPVFVDNREDLDSYLKRFERLARANQWVESTWADRLGALLTGKALDVYSGLSDEESRDYVSVKRVLFQKYLLTADGYIKRFRGAKVDREETYTQLAVGLRRYLDRWVLLSDTKETVEGLLDLYVREQMLNVVEPNLAVHLRERDPKSVDEMVRMADLYQEARREEKGRPKMVKHEHGTVIANSQGKSHGVIGGEKERNKGCFKCGSPRHIARFCQGNERIAAANLREGQTVQRNSVCYNCQSPKHWARHCPRKKETEVAASTLKFKTSASLRPAVSQFDGGKMSRAEDRELVETSEKLVSNSNVSLEMDKNSIVLSAKEQRKMYPGRYMNSGELGGPRSACATRHGLYLRCGQAIAVTFRMLDGSNTDLRVDGWDSEVRTNRRGRGNYPILQGTVTSAGSGESHR